MNQVLSCIAKTREYLDYIEEHYNNVQKAWSIGKDKWKHLPVVFDDFLYNTLDIDVGFHDISKLSEYEFVQYRKYFFPTDYEEDFENYTKGVISKNRYKEGFDAAWSHHKTVTNHHWQTIKDSSLMSAVYLTEMVLDWIAMSYKFGGTAIQHYEKEKPKMTNLNDESHDYIKKLLDLFYEEVIE